MILPTREVAELFEVGTKYSVVSHDRNAIVGTRLITAIEHKEGSSTIKYININGGYKGGQCLTINDFEPVNVECLSQNKIVLKFNLRGRFSYIRVQEAT